MHSNYDNIISTFLKNDIKSMVEINELFISLPEEKQIGCIGYIKECTEFENKNRLVEILEKHIFWVNADKKLETLLKQYR